MPGMEGHDVIPDYKIVAVVSSIINWAFRSLFPVLDRLDFPAGSAAIFLDRPSLQIEPVSVLIILARGSCAGSSNEDFCSKLRLRRYHGFTYAADVATAAACQVTSIEALIAAPSYRVRQIIGLCDARVLFTETAHVSHHAVSCTPSPFMN